jgi:hypothetical protein
MCLKSTQKEVYLRSFYELTFWHEMLLFHKIIEYSRISANFDKIPKNMEDSQKNEKNIGKWRKYVKISKNREKYNKIYKNNKL